LQLDPLPSHDPSPTGRLMIPPHTPFAILFPIHHTRLK
jgi:hypothetical protein